VTPRLGEGLPRYFQCHRDETGRVDGDGAREHDSLPLHESGQPFLEPLAPLEAAANVVDPSAKTLPFVWGRCGDLVIRSNPSAGAGRGAQAEQRGGSPLESVDDLPIEGRADTRQTGSLDGCRLEDAAIGLPGARDPRFRPFQSLFHRHEGYSARWSNP